VISISYLQTLHMHLLVDTRDDKDSCTVVQDFRRYEQSIATRSRGSKHVMSW